MSTTIKRNAKLFLFKGVKQPFQDHFFVMRHMTAAVFQPGARKTIEIMKVFDPSSLTDREDFANVIIKDPKKWKQIDVDPELLNKFYIPMSYFLLWQKELEYLGFVLPMPRVIWKNERIPV